MTLAVLVWLLMLAAALSAYGVCDAYVKNRRKRMR